MLIEQRDIEGVVLRRGAASHSTKRRRGRRLLGETAVRLRDRPHERDVQRGVQEAPPARASILHVGRVLLQVVRKRAARDDEERRHGKARGRALHQVAALASQLGPGATAVLGAVHDEGAPGQFRRRGGPAASTPPAKRGSQ